MNYNPDERRRVDAAADELEDTVRRTTAEGRRQSGGNPMLVLGILGLIAAALIFVGLGGLGR